MRRHETPSAIAVALARHGPRHARFVLDPAVGNGVLLEPFFRRRADGLQVCAVDNDSRPLRRVRSSFGSTPGKSLNVVHADFLDWACLYGSRHGQLFDCVIMNPPFAGRREKWRSMVALKNLLGSSEVPDSGPVEAGFVLGALALLKPRGRLLAVLPASLITSPSMAWVRAVMLQNGAIRHVHELPRFAFPKIESRIYLVVYEKGVKQRDILLLNHDIDKPERLWVRSDEVRNVQRFDFAFHSAASSFAALRACSPLGWRRLGDLATVWRGTKKTPRIPKAVVHTSNFIGGLWRPYRHVRSHRTSGDCRLQSRDILVQRVSRNCAKSFGLGVAVRGAFVSDCILVVRPKKQISALRLLFAIRCLMALEFGPSLLERGTGAPYLAQRELENLEIPYGLSKVCERLFGKYRKSLKSESVNNLRNLEARVAKRLKTFVRARKN